MKNINTRKILNKLFAVLIVSLVFFTLSCNTGESCDEDSCTDVDGDIDGDADFESLPDGDITDIEADSDSNDGEEQEDIVAIEDGALSGIWAMRFAIDYTTVLPLLNCKVQMLLSGIAKLQVEQDGKKLHFTEQICDMGMDIVEDIRFYVFFTDEIIAATGVQPRESELSDLHIGAEWTTTPAWDLYGVDKDKMTDYKNDPLPLDADDPLVVDFDNDGKPGLTTPICGFVGSCTDLESEVYVIMRMMRNMFGTIVSEKLITGTIDSSVEMITLGADPEYFAFQMNLQKYDDPEVNYFEMVKLDDNISCEDITGSADELFSYVPMEHATPLWVDECPKEPTN